MTIKQNRQRGKRAEALFANYLGGKRVGTLGRHDLELGMWRIEVKEIETWAGMKRFEGDIEQAVSHAPSPYIPALVYHRLGNTPDKDWVTIPAWAFKAMIERKTT